MGVYTPHIVLVAWWTPFYIADAVQADVNIAYGRGTSPRMLFFYTAVRVDYAFYTAVSVGADLIYCCWCGRCLI